MGLAKGSDGLVEGLERRDHQLRGGSPFSGWFDGRLLFDTFFGLYGITTFFTPHLTNDIKGEDNRVFTTGSLDESRGPGSGSVSRPNAMSYKERVKKG